MNELNYLQGHGKRQERGGEGEMTKILEMPSSFGSIKKLDPSLAAFIRSGSLNSVNKIVEELVYNSLDAGANEIMIKLSLNDPNCLCLEVRDNGSGIGLTSLQAYCGTDFGATSKLQTTTTY